MSAAGSDPREPPVPGCARRFVRWRTALVVATAAAVLAGCAGSSGSGGGSVDTGTGPSIGEPATTSPVRATPARTASVVTRDGVCPYFDRGFAMDTIGQHLTRSTVTSTRPYPGCSLYRPDGGKGIDIQMTVYPTASAAGEQAVTLLGRNANPVDVGDHAVVAIVGDGTRLVASKGRYLLQVFINQQSSLEARDIATAVASKIR
jgi:hypothetical protein